MRLFSIVLLSGCTKDGTRGTKPGSDDTPSVDTATHGTADPATTDTGAPVTTQETTPPEPEDRSRYANCTYQGSFDHDDDGVVDEIDIGEHDATGWLVALYEDGEADGIPDEITTYEGRNAWGLYTHAEIDFGADGSPDYLVDAVHDGLFYVSREIDTDGDGDVDELWTYTRSDTDEGGTELVAEIDLANDGTIDSVVTFFYDDRRRFVREEEEYDLGSYTSTIVYDGDRISTTFERWVYSDADFPKMPPTVERREQVYSYADAMALDPMRIDEEYRIDGTLVTAAIVDLEYEDRRLRARRGQFWNVVGPETSATNLYTWTCP